MAAAVAFYFILASAPLLVVGVSIFNAVYGRAAEQKMQQQINALAGTDYAPAPRNGVQQVIHIIADSEHGKLAVVLSFIIALVSGSSLFINLQRSLDTLWDIGKPRRGKLLFIARNRIISGAMMILVIVLFTASVALTTTMSMLLAHVGAWITSLSFVGESLLSLILTTVLFAIVYRYLPHTQIDWRDVWLGAVITAGLFVVGKLGLTVYFRFAVRHNAYGAVGAVAALLLWIYYTTMLILLGAAFTRVYAESRGRGMIQSLAASLVPDR